MNDQQRHYQPLGDFHIWQGNTEDCSDYMRCLDLSNAVCETYWTSGGVRCCRRIFASYPDNVIFIGFTADQKGMIEFTASIDGRDDNY
ncbi:MAG: glycoside hydrolase family 95 protein, partial [Oscillospiraceae bacterium]|nr:glycoside hydrolase family 95 protein [Oscillospiraceae bacterium]